MSINEACFKEIRNIDRTVTLENRRKAPSAGIGSGTIQCRNDKNEEVKITIKDALVLFVPSLEGNILSVKKLTNDGYAVEFNNDRCRIVRNGVPVVSLAYTS